MTDLVLHSQTAPGIATLTLNQPDRRNALSIPLVQQLQSYLQQLDEDAACRVILLRGAGTIFCSGLDMREVADELTADQAARGAAEVMRAIQMSSCIVVAAAQGGAYAGGAGLVAACDIVVAADDFRIGYPAARRGVLPILIFDTVRRRVSDGDLRDLFLTGQPADAVTAQRMGLVQRVVPLSQLGNEARTVADNVIAGAPQAIRATKQLLQRSRHACDSSDSAFESAVDSHVTSQDDDEMREGMLAFLENRPPRWRTS